MTQAQLISTPPNVITTLKFAWDVAHGTHDISSPDRLLAAIRQEILNTIDETLAFAAIDADDVTIGQLEIDLGAFDDPPDWDVVRQKLRDALLGALVPHLQHHTDRDGKPTPRLVSAGAETTTASVNNATRHSPTVHKLNSYLQSDDLTEFGNALSKLHTQQRANSNKALQSQQIICETLTEAQHPKPQAILATLKKIPPKALKQMAKAHAVIFPTDVTTPDDIIAAITHLLTNSKSQTVLSSTKPPKLTHTQTHQTKSIKNVQNLLADLQSALQGAKLSNKPDNIAVDTSNTYSTNSNYSFIFSNLIDDNDVISQILSRIPAGAAQLTTTITTLAKKPASGPALRSLLQNLITQNPLDIIAARKAKPVPSNHPHLKLARVLQALGDTPSAAAHATQALTSHRTPDDGSSVALNPQFATLRRQSVPSQGTSEQEHAPAHSVEAQATKTQTDDQLTQSEKRAATATHNNPNFTDPLQLTRGRKTQDVATNTYKEQTTTQSLTVKNAPPKDTETPLGSYQPDAQTAQHDTGVQTPAPPIKNDKSSQSVASNDAQNHPTNVPSSTPPNYTPHALSRDQAPQINTIDATTTDQPASDLTDTFSAEPNQTTIGRNTALGIGNSTQKSVYNTEINQPAQHSRTPGISNETPSDTSVETPNAPQTNNPAKQPNLSPETTETDLKSTDTPPAWPTPTSPQDQTNPPPQAPSVATPTDPQKTTTENISKDDVSPPQLDPQNLPTPSNGDRLNDKATPSMATNPHAQPTSIKVQMPPPTVSDRHNDTTSTAQAQLDVPALNAEISQTNQLDTVKAEAPRDASAEHVPFTPQKSANPHDTPQNDHAAPKDGTTDPATAQTDASIAQITQNRLSSTFQTVTGSADLEALFELLWSVLGEAKSAPDHDRATFWADAFSAALAHPNGIAKAKVTAFLHQIQPDERSRGTALRTAIARLGYAGHTPAPLRHQLREILSSIVAPATTTREAQPHTAAAAPHAQRFETAQAGLVLFHPYLAMLFDRLDIKQTKHGIHNDTLGQAYACLAFLATGDAINDKPADHLQKCLLGLPPDAPTPEPFQLDQDATDLIDSLMQSVISQWGRLGQTSTDGLRAAFVQRGGVIKHDPDAQSLLTVNKGPYDMLLDSLPWSINLVGLPWMPAPLIVDWRDSND